MGRLSIGQKLNKASSPERRKELALLWINEWKEEHEKTMQNIERALRAGDDQLLDRLIGFVIKDGLKRFDALPGVMRAIGAAQPDDKEKKQHEEQALLLNKAFIREDYNMVFKQLEWLKAEGAKRFEDLQKIIATSEQEGVLPE
ncbi:hypothetical protein F4V43_02360 [Paenibacillus spiritus]|uniref:Uncharacterized protein n=1 Tax=Paenibacillus spiritus TaxID=2496557 RepID=A0A5J5GGL5_9BACL|nr:hypothetical protein [Paenibacillus spiritus]KAA9007349.1 hypothetical protein F4V43_02360 [Paenibacillus spiritus]